MRIVAYLAVVLVLLALGTRLPQPEPVVVPALVEAPEDDGSHVVRIFSTGWKLQQSEFGLNTYNRGIMVDGTLVMQPSNEPGLAIVELAEGGAISAPRHFNLRDKPEDAWRLERYLDTVELGTVLAIAANTSIGLRPTATDEHRADVRAVFARLGVKSEPWTVTFQSLGYLCLASADGYQPIAETYSETRGICLTYNVPGDRSRLVGRDVPAMVDNRILFELPLERAEGQGIVAGGAHKFIEKTFTGLRATTAYGEPAKIRWDLGEVRLPEGLPSVPTFSARIAAGWSGDGRLLGIRFILRVNGVLAGERVILRDPTEMVQWLFWEERFPPDFEGIRDLEVEVEWVGSEAGDPATIYMATPLLTSGEINSL